MKRNILISVLILTLILCSYVSFANGDTNTTGDDELKSTIYQFFDCYFESYKNKEAVSFDGIVESNNNTSLFKSMHEWKIEESKIFSTGYKFYNYDLSFNKIDIQGNTADIDLKMSAKYQHERFEVDSAMYNIGYKFSLKLENEGWIIYGIDTDFDTYQNFKRDVEKEAAKTDSNRRSSSESQESDDITENIISEVKTEKINDLGVMKNQFEMVFSDDASNDLELESNQNALIAAATYSYNVSNGVSYAQRFGEAHLTDRLFYTAGSDCTNFVSQCVWAAYGGYVSSSDTQTKSNISNKVRMVSSSWYAGTGGGSSNWESVTSFWNYAIGSKTVGPLANGYNNNSVYTSLSPSSIAVGDVLQVRDGSSGSYGHSVYVTYKVPDSAGVPITYNMISVSQHSSDAVNRPLSDLISNWGGSSCNLRELRFRSSSFDK